MHIISRLLGHCLPHKTAGSASKPKSPQSLKIKGARQIYVICILHTCKLPGSSKALVHLHCPRRHGASGPPKTRRSGSPRSRYRLQRWRRWGAPSEGVEGGSGKLADFAWPRCGKRPESCPRAGSASPQGCGASQLPWYAPIEGLLIHPHPVHPRAFRCSAPAARRSLHDTKQWKFHFCVLQSFGFTSFRRFASPTAF